MEDDFLQNRAALPAESHRSAYQRAVTLMRSRATKAFDLDEEPKALRDRYGRNLFGQGCLLARRLVERGVPFVEVSLATVGNLALGWDTHINNFDSVQQLSEVLDPAWATLMDDLKERGLLDIDADRLDGRVRPHAEDQRQPRPRSLGQLVDDRAGRRRHQGRAGRRQDQRRRHGGRGPAGRRAGLPGHRRRRPWASTPSKQNKSNVGRPIRIVEPTAKPIKEVLA